MAQGLAFLWVGLRQLANTVRAFPGILLPERPPASPTGPEKGGLASKAPSGSGSGDTKGRLLGHRHGTALACGETFGPAMIAGRSGSKPFSDQDALALGPGVTQA